MRVVRMVLLLALVFAASAVVWAGTPSQTAQSIMVVFNNSGSYAIVGTQVWKLDITAAAGYFTNQYDGNVTCNWNGNPNNNPCGALTAPTAPLPLDNAVTGNGGFQGQGNIGHDGVVGDEKCILLSGGTLYSEPYTQPLDDPNVKNVTWTYEYLVAPDPANDIDSGNPGVQVAPFTAWYLFQDNGSQAAQITMNAFIAGQSVVKNKTVGTKYSFSIVEPDVPNRVQNLVLTIKDSGGNIIFTAYPGSTVVTNAPGSTPNPTANFGDVFLPFVSPNDDGSLDFWYKQNAGTNIGANGYVALLVNNIDARNLLNGVGGYDTFAGNQNGGFDGSLRWPESSWTRRPTLFRRAARTPSR